MPAVNYNFIIEQGSDFQLSFKYNDENGNPINLSDKCVVIQWSSIAKQYVFSSASNADENIDNWFLSGDNGGNIIFRLTAQLTKDFDFDTAVYDLDVRDTAGTSIRNTRLCTGTITLVKRNLPLVLDCPTNKNGVIGVVTPTVTVTNGTTPTGVTPTPTNTTSLPQEDLCLPDDCINLDIYSTVYTGNSITIPDLTTASGTISTLDDRLIENVELAINKLQHQSPSDLVFIVQPPSGDSILLSANSKIPSYNNNFSFMFSNKADQDSYLHNINNGGICNIYNKTDLINDNNQPLLYNFDHLFGASVTGDWSLVVKDTDPLGSGVIDSWKLIITYVPINYDEA